MTQPGNHHPGEGPPSTWGRGPNHSANFSPEVPGQHSGGQYQTHASAVPGVWLPQRPLTGVPGAPSAYTQLWRVTGLAWWRPHVAVALAGTAYVLLQLMGARLQVAIYQGSGSVPLSGKASFVLSLVAGTATSALMIPTCLLLSRLTHQSGGWLSSVVGRTRWKWLLMCLIAGVFPVVGFLLVFRTEGLGMPTLMAFGPNLIGAVFYLGVPLQVAGIEYFLRGVVARGAASLVSSAELGAVLGALVSSSLFVLMSAARPGFGVWGGVTLFVGGLILSWLVWRTGGLEASVAAGSVLFILLPVTSRGIAETTSPEPMQLLVLLPVAVLAVLIAVIAQARKIQRTTQAPVMREL